MRCRIRLHAERIDDRIVEALELKASDNDLKTWETIVERIKHPSKNVTIALVGKYIDLKEAYKSLCEALTHGGIANDARVDICWVDSEDIESKGAAEMLKGMDGILVPGGFGIRGVEGKIAAVKYARENKIPYFGICLGMQCAVIETARNLAASPEREQFGVRPEDAASGYLPYRTVVRLPQQDRPEGEISQATKGAACALVRTPAR